MPTAALMAGGSVISGGLGALGSIMGSNTMANYGSQALAQLQSTLAPLLAQGKGIVDTALGPLAKLLTPGVDMTATLSQMPGFKFAQDWGQQTVKNLGTTLGLGGNTLTAGANFATGLASQGYNSIVSQLQNLLQSGTSLESSTAGALGSGSAAITQGIGQSKAAGTLGMFNALGGAASGVGNAGVIGTLLNKLNLNNNATPAAANSGIYSGPFGPGTQQWSSAEGD